MYTTVKSFAYLIGLKRCFVLFYNRSNIAVAFSDRVCSDHRFLCQSGQCISLDFRCDNIPHCTNGSDERNCRSKNICFIFLTVVMFILCSNYIK